MRDTEQFAALVNRQARFVFQVAYAVVRNTHDAEDVVQETFLKLHRSGAWKSMENERAFLARAAWRMAVDRRPKRLETELADQAWDGQNPEQAAIEENQRDLVRRMAASLPEDLRLPLALSAVDGMTSVEIAAAMGIPEGTVRTRLARARQVLREKLESTWKVTSSKS